MQSQTAGPLDTGRGPTGTRLRGTGRRQDPTPLPPPHSRSRETVAPSVAAGGDTMAPEGSAVCLTGWTTSYISLVRQEPNCTNPKRLQTTHIIGNISELL